MPTSSTQVSIAVKVLAAGACQFAIRSGGHTPWPGASNIQNGVTIDLRAMKSVTLSKDRTVAAVGPGATWAEVYQALDPLGVAVGGGRAAGVGVGGLTTGGGNEPHFSRIRRWTLTRMRRRELLLRRSIWLRL